MHPIFRDTLDTVGPGTPLDHGFQFSTNNPYVLSPA